MGCVIVVVFWEPGLEVEGMKGWFDGVGVMIKVALCEMVEREFPEGHFEVLWGVGFDVFPDR
jgi:hypothetical protein